MSDRIVLILFEPPLGFTPHMAFFQILWCPVTTKEAKVMDPVPLWVSSLLVEPGHRLFQ